VDGINIVMRNTFLELEIDTTSLVSEASDVASCCCSDHASETTAAVSKSDETDSWGGDMTDDEFDVEPRRVSTPPGNFSVAPMTLARQMFMVMGVAPFEPSTSATASTIVTDSDNKFRTADNDPKARHVGSVWGSKRKQRKEASYTTVVVKNLPEKCTNAMILDLLDKFGFATQYDFVYVPTDFRNYSAFGYAFVNLVSHQAADMAIEQLDGIVAWNQSTPLDVDWSMPHQGYAVHVRRYQNSPVMHQGVPRKYKPMIFRNGVLQKFPEPTKKIKEPRLRRGAVPAASA
jgi:hypothetical protein